jgi:bis(5'-nucleosidyl)-tetraphosphatase
MRNEKSCGCIVVHDNKVLMVRQNNGVFGFPKGHVEFGESEVETAKREVKEETNVDVEINNENRFVISYMANKDVFKQVTYFLAKPIDDFKVLRQEKEIYEINWIDIEEVETKLHFNNVKKLWKKARKYI